MSVTEYIQQFAAFLTSIINYLKSFFDSLGGKTEE